jgi:hypothetical protein
MFIGIKRIFRNYCIIQFMKELIGGAPFRALILSKVGALALLNARRNQRMNIVSKVGENVRLCHPAWKPGHFELMQFIL